MAHPTPTVTVPAESILEEFELPVISESFGGYTDELRRRLA